jgi:hypothetical protein
MGSIARAQPLLNQAVDSVPKTARDEFLSQFEWPNKESGYIEQEISSQKIRKKYEGMINFDQENLLRAGDILFKALDDFLASADQKEFTLAKSLTIKSPWGPIFIGSSGDDIYSQENLDDAVLLIDLGGRNTYLRPLGFAEEKEIRLVIDFGSDIEIKNESGAIGNVGSGVFGIGVVSFPNPKGTKKITSGSFSQGYGIGGIGCLSVNGPADLKGDRFVQGTGVFGLGILYLQNSDGTTLQAVRSGQGCAFVKGVGILISHGNNMDVRGGLVEPDPREPNATVSLCQGVGFGERAFSGGGVGVAVLSGNNNKVMGSYFSQGCGYWHSLGIFRSHGDNGLFQARRYDMGSGVHSAFGHFQVLGDNNRLLNWGVGPAYGWDRSIASAIVSGTNNEIQVDWGAGVANIGSLSYGYYKLNQSRIKMCALGDGQFFRNEPSYSLQTIDGKNNKAECLSTQSALFANNIWLKKFVGSCRFIGR